MRALSLLIATLILTLATTEVSASVCRKLASEREPSASSGRFSCRILTGYGTAIGYGSSKAAAREKAWEVCGDKMIDAYIAQRGSIPEEVIGDLTTACINKECQ